MQSDLGKLFVGGISWDTNEERLKGYFSSFGEVLEAMIMKDRSTGRARGFGFIVFADPAVAEKVIKEKHSIDGRMVEAKKAVPRDDQSTMSRSSSSIQGSPGPGRTRKIFVGGLASTVTESDFKKYFEQFGTITDVVVMYDHNTQRPRGFGFITYDSEDAVDKVLLRTFHELNGKMVEVKRAVPKELSPGPTRSPLGGYKYSLSRVNNFLSDYSQGYSPNAVGGYGLRMDGRFNPIPGDRSGFAASFGSGYGMGLNFEPGLNPNFGGSANFNNALDYGRGMNPYYISNSNRFSNPVGYDGGNGGNASFFSSGTRNLWRNGGLNYGTNSAGSSAYIGSGSGSIGGAFADGGLSWGSTPISPQGGGNISNHGGNLGYRVGNSSYDLGGGSYGRNAATNGPPSSSYATSNGGDAAFGDFYGGNSVYGDWLSKDSEIEASASFGFGLGNGISDGPVESSPSYVGGYSTKRQANRGFVG
ncbi:heterogeneous nuclear ribonucleoprotein 1 [Diospyros lotus]|uniref:heterogeneous nuclear ribonucleoprotein 1 n=1 Tax=Diospyros lotus TaxID=55363 RepID=UPI00224FD552|nr:heterogeneous nuclear ribonucleoprotein 1 [Diospyros lotus]